MCPISVNLQQPPFPQPGHENMDQNRYQYPQSQSQHPQQQQHPLHQQHHPQQQQQHHPQQQGQHPQQQQGQHPQQQPKLPQQQQQLPQQQQQQPQHLQQQQQQPQHLQQQQHPQQQQQGQHPQQQHPQQQQQHPQQQQQGQHPQQQGQHPQQQGQHPQQQGQHPQQQGQHPQQQGQHPQQQGQHPQQQGQHPQQQGQHPQQQGQHPQQQGQHPQQKHPQSQQQDVQHQNPYYYPQQFQVKQEPADYYSPMVPNGYVNSMYNNDMQMNGLPPHNGIHMNGVYNGNMATMNNGYPPRNGFHIKQEPMYCNNPNQMLNPVGQLQNPAVSTALASTATTKRKGKSKKVKQETLTDAFPVKKRRKVDRFNGMPEEEVAKRVLPDHLKLGLDIMIIGINPGLFAAYKGHHYAGPGNHFWKCLYLSGLIPEPMTAMDDYKLLDFGIGFTNIVERTSRGSADLSKKEIKEGAKILLEKVKQYKPKIAVFNGKGIYEVFNGSKNFEIGRQPEPMEGTDTVIYVMPSSSARCSQFPRAQDKVKFYLKLKELREEIVSSSKSVANTSTEGNKSPTIHEEPSESKEDATTKNDFDSKELGSNDAKIENVEMEKQPVIKTEPCGENETGCIKEIDIKLEKNIDGTIPASNLHFLTKDGNINNCSSTPATQNGLTQEHVKIKQEPKENEPEQVRCSAAGDAADNSPQPCSLSQRMLQTASWVQSLPSLPMENRFEDQIPNISNPPRSQYFHQPPHGSIGYYPPPPPQQMSDQVRMNQHLTSTTWMAGNQQMMFSSHPMAGHAPMISSPYTQAILAHSSSISQSISSISNAKGTSLSTSQHRNPQTSSR